MSTRAYISLCFIDSRCSQIRTVGYICIHVQVPSINPTRHAILIPCTRSRLSSITTTNNTTPMHFYFRQQETPNLTALHAITSPRIDKTKQKLATLHSQYIMQQPVYGCFHLQLHVRRSKLLAFTSAGRR